MPWLTEFLHRKVYDASGSSVGRVSDVLASRGKYPRVSGFEIRRGRGEPAFVPWEQISVKEKRISTDAADAGIDPPPGQLSLKIDLLDRQIVDTDGARVVRVNDILLQESSAGVRVVGAEVGIAGALRQLGIERPVRQIADTLGYQINDSLIAWNYVAPFEERKGDVRLTVPNRILKELHPSELADILDQLDVERRESILRMMTAAELAETLPEAEPSVTREAVQLLSDQRTRTVLELMPPDEAADLLGDIGYERAERLLSLMGVKEASMLRELLGYPPDTAGGRMTPSFVAVDRGATAGEAIETIRRSAREAETINYAYVLDEAGTLVGVLSLRALLRSPPDRPVLEIMQRDVVSVTVDDDQETAGRTISRYNLLAVPVVEEDGQMKGIVTVDDVVEVMEEEASEDLGEVAGVYVGQGHGLTSGRLAGFGISLAGGVLAAVLLRTQRPLLASIAAMAWLLPPYLRMTQDLGTWSLARSLASSTLHPKRQMDVLAYEMLAALAGAAVTGGLVWGIGHILTGSASAALLMGIGIFVGTLAASLIGLGLPSVLRALKMHSLLARGRPLQVIVGLSGLVIYVWVLGSLAGRI